MGESEVFFRGTQELEKEVIALLSTDLLKAEDDSCDGYIASGGTEANIQAAWIYRNEFIQKYQATHEEIALIGSEDTHYSIAKAANLLHLKWYKTSVDFHTREIIPEALDAKLAQAQKDGIKYCIVIANKGTTMFGSIDDPDVYVTALQKVGMTFRIHVDGAFGGFMVPPTDTTSKADFSHPHVSSITLDAHKMLQAPYGTGIFIARKGLMEYTCTREAQYVHGMDNTLSGSRSGANAIAVWMILFTYGPFGWLEKINKLIYRTKWCCKELDQLNVRYYNRPGMNIITIQAEDLPATLADAYGLVPDAHEGKANWYKIVIMDHVEMEHLQALIHDIKALKKG
jgi:tyrosine decarboxylase/aspartate 1-decarboxylase